MKKIQIFLILFATLCMILSLGSYTQARRSPRAEILIVNDTETQISLIITTERYGRKQWTLAPDKSIHPGMDGIRVRVSEDDEIEIADRGKAQIGDVAMFTDGIWRLSLRHARRELHRR